MFIVRYVVIFLTILSSLESISIERYQESDHVVLIPTKLEGNIFTKRDATKRNTCDVPKWFGCGETKVRFSQHPLQQLHNEFTTTQDSNMYVQRYERRCIQYEKRSKIKCRVDNECRTRDGEFSYCDMSGTCFSRSCACLPGRPRRENRPSNVSVHLNCGDRSSSSFSPTLVSDKVYWLHVPKAGTSFLNTIFHWACPRVPSEIFLAKGIRSFYHRNWQQWAWCDVEFTDITPGHFPYVESRDRGHAVGLFRKPQQRVMSAYASGLHHYGMKDSDSTRMRNAVLEAARNGDSLGSLRTYVNWRGIPSCQTKMVLGYKCASDEITLDSEDLRRAMDIVENDFLFVGITEDFDRSVCLFHAMLGGVVNPNEFKNSRPTSSNPFFKTLREKIGDESASSLKSLFQKSDKDLYDETALTRIQYADPYDEALYAHVRQLFYKRAAMFDLEPCLSVVSSL